MGSWPDARRGGGNRTPRVQDGYNTAAICEHGHVATQSLELSPDLAGKFCKECGAAVLTTCPNCNTALRGYYQISGVFSTAPYTPPNFCEDCGKSFPWMTEKLNAASSLIDELENFSDADREKAKQALTEITRDVPSTPVATARLKKMFGKATDAVGQALWKITIDVATQAAKKGLLGP